MVTGKEFDEAVALAHLHPNLGVGLHVVAVCGQAVLPPSQIPHLVDSTGNFPEDPFKAGLRYQFNSLARQELHLEIRAQLEKFCQTGLQLSHIDGHLHMHSHPVVLRTLVELADEFNIKVIRLPSEELRMTLALNRRNLLDKLIVSGVFTGLRRYGEHLLKSKGIAFADRVYGLLETGCMTEEYLLGLIPQITSDLVEFYSHPRMAIVGEPKHGQAELDALLSHRVREVLAKSDFELTNYKDWQRFTAN
ncbi:MAG: hopanoid biosynthesis-associated protein HpnK [Chamaesiphon sp.]